MTEQIVWTATPLKDAINKVTKNRQFQWRLRDFTSNDKHYWNGQPAKTGVRIQVSHPKHGWLNYTIRDDYDFAHGERPSGKGCHVNVEAPSEKIAYCFTNYNGMGYVEQCWDHISERVSVDGQEEAAKWYMRGRNGFLKVDW